jgi:hypothetical protein
MSGVSRVCGAEKRQRSASPLSYAHFVRYAVRFSIAAEAAEKRQRSASPLSSVRFALYAVRFSIAAEAAEKRQRW